MTEDQLEQEALGWLGSVGYTHLYGPDIAFDGKPPERTTISVVADFFDRGELINQPFRHFLAGVFPQGL